MVQYLSLIHINTLDINSKKIYILVLTINFVISFEIVLTF